MTSRAALALATLVAVPMLGVSAANAGTFTHISFIKPDSSAWAMPYILRPRSMTTTAALAGSWRMAQLLAAQLIVAFDVRFRFAPQA